MFSISPGPAVGGGEFLTQDRSPWINGEDSLLGKSLHAAKPVTLLIKETFSEVLCSVIRSVDSWWHGEWLASYFMHSKQKNTQMWMSALHIHCFWNKALRNLSSLGWSSESEKQCKGKTLLCFLSTLSPLHHHFTADTMSEFSPNRAILWPAWCHLTKFWYYLPGDGVWSHKLRVQPHKTAPAPTFFQRSRGQVFTCASAHSRWEVPTTHSFASINLLQQLRETFYWLDHYNNKRVTC